MGEKNKDDQIAVEDVFANSFYLTGTFPPVTNFALGNAGAALSDGTFVSFLFDWDRYSLGNPFTNDPTLSLGGLWSSADGLSTFAVDSSSALGASTTGSAWQGSGTFVWMGGDPQPMTFTLLTQDQVSAVPVPTPIAGAGEGIPFALAPPPAPKSQSRATIRGAQFPVRTRNTRSRSPRPALGPGHDEGPWLPVVSRRRHDRHADQATRTVSGDMSSLLYCQIERRPEIAS